MRSRTEISKVVMAAAVVAAVSASLSALPLTTAFNYQGQLKVNGVPYTGSADLIFALKPGTGAAAPTVGGPVQVNDVQVSNGLFVLQLDFGATAYNGDARWLDVSVRTPHDPTDTAAFQTLSPRQALTATPYATQTRGLFVDDALNIGIGTTSPTSALDVAGAVKATSFVGDGSGLTNIASSGGLWSENAPDIYYNAGNVGIGTSTPSDRLTIFDGELSLQTDDNLQDSSLFFQNSGGAYSWRIYRTDAGGNDADLRFAGGDSDQDISLLPERLVISKSGLVGIGTTAPTENLHVVAGSSPEVRIENTSSGTAAVGLVNTDREYSIRMTTTEKLVLRDVTAGDVDRLTVATDGNVGIGTTNPGAMLDVAGSFQADGSTFNVDATNNRVGINTTTPEFRLDVDGAIRAKNGKIKVTDGGTNERVVLDHAATDDVGTVVTKGPTSNNVVLTYFSGYPDRGALAVKDELGTSQVVAYAGATAGVVQVQDSSGNSMVTLDGTSDGGRLLVEDAAGVNRINASAVGDGAQVKLNDPSGNNMVTLDVVANGGRLLLADAAGINRVNAQATGDGGQVEIRDTAGNDRVSMYVAGDGGGRLQVRGPNGNLNAQITVPNDRDNEGWIGVYDSSGASKASLYIDPNGDGRMATDVMQINGGSDIAEPFNVNSDGATVRRSDEGVAPGMVVTIDPTRAGELRLSTRAYDRTVAGIISGAGGVKPGLTLQQPGTLADGKHPVALTGRVWCFVDADTNSVQPGDLLTTSDTPGHAMKVTDHGRAQGAIIGKAMTSLKSGKGLVMVLVSLQ